MANVLTDCIVQGKLTAINNKYKYKYISLD